MTVRKAMYPGKLPHLLTILLVCGLPLGSTHATLGKRSLDPSWTTDPSQFYRRGYHNSVLLGETLYIDGGDGFHLNSNGSGFWVDTFNSTYALDLSTSWSPKDVQFQVIDKGGSPVLNRPNLWPAPDAKSFYHLNGDVSQALQFPWSEDRDPPLDPELWQFTPEGIESGTWQLVETESSLIGSQSSKSTSGNGSAYILGGITTWRSTEQYNGSYSFVGSANGIISYNSDSQTWNNQSMDGLASSGWWLEGELRWIDNLGGAGLVVALGGLTALPTSTLVGQSLVSFDDIAFFNPLTGEWRKQTTTGSIPTSRRRACSVGVPGDNGTYEIFLHGGDASATEYEVKTPSQASIDLDQVWVLSIPSFTWYKSSYNPSDARFVHTCHVAGNPPRRQMIAVGGETPGVSNYDQPPDTWPQGLAILDLTELQWIESYDSDAAPYQTPQLVKDGISVNGTYPQTWNDPVVVEWLLGKSLADITSVANPTGNSTSSTAGSSDLEAKDLSTGAIVGIAVGSVIGLALLGICAWCFRRARLRQRQRKNIIAQDDPSCYEKPELDSVASPRLNEKPELACIISENQHSLRREYNDSHELGPPVQYEMEGSIAGQELSSDTAVNTSDRSRSPLVGSVVDSNSKSKGVDTRPEMHELAGTT